MAKIKKPDIDKIAEQISTNEHSFDKHKADLNRPKSGEPVGIETRQDLKNFIKEILNDPDTKGFVANPDGPKMYFYNERTNTFVIVDPNSAEGGTIFRGKTPAHGPKRFAKMIEDTADKTGKMPSIIRGGIHELVDQFNKANGAWAKIGRFFGEGASFLGKLSKVLGPIGIAAAAAEALGLLNKAKAAVDNGLLPKEALLEYEGVLALHAAQAAGDPTLVGGEVGVQLAFEEWCEKYNIPDYLKKELEPSSLVEMITGDIKMKETMNAIPREIEPDMPEQVKKLATLKNHVRYAKQSEVQPAEADDHLSPETLRVDSNEAEAALHDAFNEMSNASEIDIVTSYIEKERIFQSLPDKLDALSDSAPPEIAALVAAKETIMCIDEKFLELNRAGLQEHGTEAKAVELMDQRTAAKEMFNEQYATTIDDESISLEELLKDMEQNQNDDWKPVTGDGPSTPISPDSGWKNLNDFKM